MKHNDHQSLFDRIGEEELSALVDRFYTYVKADPLIRDLFPDDMGETIRKQKQFLTQFCGGPQLYTNEHGHPMLRMKHIPFVITKPKSDAWLSCMSQALEESLMDEYTKQELLARLTYTANHMINSKETHTDDQQGGTTS
ncbi:globin domain-containing protein [Salisediminibacterium selenitireducens]|uniref:Globin n=1 Tax=Bacillus selenitireducens (strain ATCC 700615 / DSM 15326 / MLS10) TaxID=439292 RepID=D6XTC7_BACIE|nr:globin [Salisediminibacterium selenitireducens]ADH99063.1 globin [[Bacillus] selenitireducens MLS10]